MDASFRWHDGWRGSPPSRGRADESATALSDLVAVEMQVVAHERGAPGELAVERVRRLVLGLRHPVDLEPARLAPQACEFLNQGRADAGASAARIHVEVEEIGDGAPRP